MTYNTGLASAIGIMARDLYGLQRPGYDRRIFEAASWGGEFHPDFRPSAGELIAQEHWCSSGFANTDLDLLKQQGIHKLIVIGLRAHTCIDSMVRFAVELGYDVTLVKDAIASYRWEEMKATLELNAPNYATAIFFRRRSHFSAVNKQLRSENVSGKIYR